MKDLWHIERASQRSHYHVSSKLSSISILTSIASFSNIITTALQDRSTSKDAEARLRLCQKWLQDCIENHTNCAQWQEQNAVLPTRVIDVGPKNDSQRPCLLETKGETGAYVALSHRWGGSKVLTTTASTLEARKSGMSMDELPKTFRDAVRITRFMGYRYLWIDSLCIMVSYKPSDLPLLGPAGLILSQQDNLEDWETEAGKMGTIYRNACFTIVAAAATSADSGCFQHSDSTALSSKLPCFLGTVRLSQSCAEHQSHSIQVFANRDRVMRTDSHNDAFRPPSSLDTRAWVLQEQVLSGRSMIFAEDGMYWECTSLTASEGFPMGTTGSHTNAPYPGMGSKAFYPGRSNHARGFRQVLLSHFQDPDRSKPMDFPLQRDVPDLALSSNRLIAMLFSSELKKWNELVSDYTSRELTHESDRLIAIKGLATLMQKTLGDDYHAGLWRSAFEQQLLWHTFDIVWEVDHACDCLGPEQTRWTYSVRPWRQRTASPIAPSWSWACSRQRVEYSDPDPFEYFIRILEVKTVERDGCIEGFVELQGLLRPVRAIVTLEDQGSGKRPR